MAAMAHDAVPTAVILPCDDLAAFSDEGALAVRSIVDMPNMSEHRINAWAPMYMPMSDFDISTISLGPVHLPRVSSTFLDEGTFKEVHKLSETRVVAVAKQGWTPGGPASDEQADDEVNFVVHYATELDNTCRIRKAAGSGVEPRWASVPYAFTFFIDRRMVPCQVKFVFFSVRHTPLRQCIPMISRPKTAEERQAQHRHLFFLVVSAWWVEHVARVAHRDIKPANVVVTCDGRPVLTDFGSAAPLGRYGSPGYYQNPPWFSPEECLAVKYCNRYQWGFNSSAYAIGLIMLMACWGTSKFEDHFPQQRPENPKKKWLDAVMQHRDRNFYANYAVYKSNATSLLLAALMLTDETESNRKSLAYIAANLYCGLAKDSVLPSDVPEDLWLKCQQALLEHSA